MSVITRLAAVSERPRTAVLAGLEFNDTKILKAVRPGDQLAVTKEHVHKRESLTRQDRGIVSSLIEVKNQNDELCLSTISVILVAKRPTG